MDPHSNLSYLKLAIVFKVIMLNYYYVCVFVWYSLCFYLLYKLCIVCRLDVLITLALSADLTTQEYATEALAECLTVPAIQDQFISLGGKLFRTKLM